MYLVDGTYIEFFGYEYHRYPIQNRLVATFVSDYIRLNHGPDAHLNSFLRCLLFSICSLYVVYYYISHSLINKLLCFQKKSLYNKIKVMGLNVKVKQLNKNELPK